MSKINVSELKKLYYTIGEVADMFDVNTSLIRFWEKEFPVIQPKKNKKGNRLFTPKEIGKIDRIYTLVKLEGYTLDGAKKAMRSKSSSIQTSSSEESSSEDIINRLEGLKERLLSLKI
ncbi:MAG: MerR family transcriptional regulator [bacterium]|nr:MerR family transcriptional regulator [bacterium]